MASLTRESAHIILDAVPASHEVRTWRAIVDTLVRADNRRNPVLLPLVVHIPIGGFYDLLAFPASQQRLDEEFDQRSRRVDEMMSSKPEESTPIVLVTPEAKADLAAEVDRAGYLGDLTGGLLFGYPYDEGRRIIVSSVRLTSAVGFGRQDFSLDQTRTSRQLDHARSLAPQANYCGVWYLHRTPNRELGDEEWVQMQVMLEDPDFPFDDLVCLVLCFYSGKLQMHASSFNHYQSNRSQAPAPTELRLTTEEVLAPIPVPEPTAAPRRDNWYTSQQIAGRLSQEHERLAAKYKTETARTSDGQIYFRLVPKNGYDKLAFCLAVGPGFPEKAPHVFLLLSGKPRRVSIPSLGGWSPSSQLVTVADELVEWLVFSVNEYMTAAVNAINHGRFAEAADLATLVLTINPQTPGAPRLLAKAQARL
jgi:hypothetical protein